MVRVWIIGTLVAAAVAPVARAQPDWRSAGGEIFASSEPSPEVDPNSREPRLPEGSQPFDAAVGAAAARHRLDPKLLHALVAVESAYRPRAVSPAGAGGLTQLMPGTATALGIVDRFDAAANLSGGADYLARQLLRFGDVRLALAAYNAGPERVARLGRIPNIAETQSYVAAVIECYLALSAGRSIRSASDCRRGP
ncbi:lytic transglycosylase domain-containing protein [Phenylobacterium sp. SCN 70-31]|uniref:lytic transglycosylase domain-containing protein n=1 Tax=Phenylobacterium sp. SCN 70-31 TaxID=1660129 RepID=UPI00086F34D2|nr:lytic transglycosylase domain-containing protein [Phenylobacterium sp. SCN 70-31]ODT85784.1 MAG: transglycosylase [Phenylobacterium sp. SCN 70-31]